MLMLDPIRAVVPVTTGEKRAIEHVLSFTQNGPQQITEAPKWRAEAEARTSRAKRCESYASGASARTAAARLYT